MIFGNNGGGHFVFQGSHYGTRIILLRECSEKMNQPYNIILRSKHLHLEMVFAIWTIQATDKHQMQSVINLPNVAAILIFQHIYVSTMVLMDSLYLITYKEVFYLCSYYT